MPEAVGSSSTTSGARRHVTISESPQSLGGCATANTTKPPSTVAELMPCQRWNCWTRAAASSGRPAPRASATNLIDDMVSALLISSVKMPQTHTAKA